MVFLVFACRVAEPAVVRLNDEFDDWAWVDPERLERYDLNEATVDTLRQAKLLPEAAEATS